MHNQSKRTMGVTLTLVLIASIVLFAALNTLSVSAQGSQATVTVLDAVGGTTDPAPGSNSYNDGQQVVFTATPDPNFVFLQWIISADTFSTSIENPMTVTFSAGTTYEIQPVFQPASITILSYTPPLNTSAFALVRVLASVGGTTNPSPGLYALESAKQLQLSAVASSGFTFSHWVVSGSYMPGHGGNPGLDTNIPTDNPLVVGHGEGYEYTYQPVFLPVGSNPPPNPSGSSGISTELIIAIVAIVIAIIVVIAAVTYVKRSKK